MVHRTDQPGGDPRSGGTNLAARALATCRQIGSDPLRVVERHYRARAGSLGPERVAMWAAARRVLIERGVELPHADDRDSR
jgi:hypothetical protein